jgi:hypothetical protein
MIVMEGDDHPVGGDVCVGFDVPESKGDCVLKRFH